MNTLLIVMVLAGALVSGYTLSGGRTDGTVVVDNSSYGSGEKEEAAILGSGG